MSRFKNIILVLAIPLALALAWYAGDMRKKEAKVSQLSHISYDISGLSRISQELYQGHLTGNPEKTVYVAHTDYPSYGGPKNRDGPVWHVPGKSGGPGAGDAGDNQRCFSIWGLQEKI